MLHVTDTEWMQTNPTIAGGSDWRFYVTAGGDFRAISRLTKITGLGSASKTEDTYEVYRVEGGQLAPAAP